MSLHTIGNKIIFSSLTEHLKLDELKGEDAIVKGIREALSESEAGVVEVDFSTVGRVNSIGLNSWINALLKLKPTITYVKVPPWLVEQFNERRRDLLSNAAVESIFVPFFNLNSGTQELKLMKMGSEIPYVQTYKGLEKSFEHKNGGGDTLELDVDLNQYLDWIIDPAPQFRK